MNKNEAIPLPKKRLLNNRYRIERKLAEGGFGITYLAEDSRGERYVVKEHFPTWFSYRDKSGGVIYPVGGEEERYRESMKDFHREAMQLSVLDHPNIVRLVDAFEENGTAYYIMPYLTEGDLAYVIRTMHEKQNFLSQAALLQLLRTLLRALDHMHSRSLHNNRIYHFDIKPANVMLRYTEDQMDVQPVLIDFGAPGIGTPGYLPHEQRDASDIGPWCDLYALGATMYKLLTNMAPPSHLDAQFEPLPREPRRSYLCENPELCARYDYDLLDSIDRALEWEPSARFQTAAQWYDAIKGIPVKFMDNGASVFDFVRKEKESSLPLLIAGGAAAFFAVLLVVLVYIFFMADTSSSSTSTPSDSYVYTPPTETPYVPGHRCPDGYDREALAAGKEAGCEDCAAKLAEIDSHRCAEATTPSAWQQAAPYCSNCENKYERYKNHQCPSDDNMAELRAGEDAGCSECASRRADLERKQAEFAAHQQEDHSNPSDSFVREGVAMGCSQCADIEKQRAERRAHDEKNHDSLSEADLQQGLEFGCSRCRSIQQLNEHKAKDHSAFSQDDIRDGVAMGCPECSRIQQQLKDHLDKDHANMSEAEMEAGAELGCSACAVALEKQRALRNHTCPASSERAALQAGADIGCDKCAERLEAIDNHTCPSDYNREKLEAGAQLGCDKCTERLKAIDNHTCPSDYNREKLEAGAQLGCDKCAEKLNAVKNHSCSDNPSSWEQAAPFCETCRKKHERLSNHQCPDKDDKKALQEGAAAGCSRCASRLEAVIQKEKKDAEDKKKADKDKKKDKPKKPDTKTEPPKPVKHTCPSASKKNRRALQQGANSGCKTCATRLKQITASPTTDNGGGGGGTVKPHNCPSNKAVKAAIRGSATHKALIRGANSGCAKCRQNLNWWNKRH